MKSIEELMAIRDKTRKNMTVREDTGDSKIRVVVGMATCGIAAGARPVLNAFVDEIAKRDVKGVSVQQTGCIGMCQYEPIVEVTEPGKEKVTYVKMTPEKAVRVVNDHIVNGNPVAEFTVGAIKEVKRCIVHMCSFAAVPAVPLQTVPLSLRRLNPKLKSTASKTRPRL